jgi:hypothetical protein
VFGNRVRRKAYRPKRKKVKRDWRKLDEEELHVSRSSSGDQIKTGGECGACGGKGKCIQYISGKHKFKVVKLAVLLGSVLN